MSEEQNEVVSAAPEAQPVKHATLFAALAAAQGEISNPKKERTAKVKMTKGGSYEYKYADIADVLTTVLKTFSKHGIAVLQPTRIEGNAMFVETVLAHAHSDEQFTSIYPACSIGADHKSMGAAITYARRYALCSLAGVAAEDDNSEAESARIDTDSNWTRERPEDRMPTQRKSSAQAKRDGDWEEITSIIDSANSLDELRDMWSMLQPTIKQLKPDWREQAEEYKDKRKDALTAIREAAVPPPVTPAMPEIEVNGGAS